MQRERLIALFFMIVLSFALSAGEEAATFSKKQFEVFDCTIYRSKPNLAEYGVAPIKIIYGDEMQGMTTEAWYKKYKPGVLPDTFPSPQWLAKLGKKYERESVVVLDYEGIKAYGVSKDKYRRDIQEYVKMAQAFKSGSGADGSKVGFYEVPPIADWGRVIHGGVDPSLRADNDLLKPLVEAVDVIFPSMYTWDPDVNVWLNAASVTIAEARRISQGKPVYVFVWPRYHEFNKTLSHQLIPADMWRRELEYIYKYADGIVIWDGDTSKWDENWPWWKETKDFLKRIGKY